MENEIILSTHNLTKRYGTYEALSDVNMTVRRGDIYGFVGLNGSGKTTLIRVVTGLIKKSGGHFSLFGEKEGKLAHGKVGSMVETPSLYLNLTAMENLKVQTDLCGLVNNDLPAKLLKLVNLEGTGKKKVKNFSLGMRQRLGIAICLVGNPEFLLLDEPTNGLDPEGIVELRELLVRLCKETGITILVSSHILSELSKLATTYGFIHKGKLIKEISAEELFSNVETKTVATVDDLQAATALLEGRFSYTVSDNKLVIDAEIPLYELVDLMREGGVKVMNAERTTQDLESYFMRLIGGNKNVRK